MASIAHQPLEFIDGDPWSRVVAQARAWADEHTVALRDAVVLLPFAQHLPLARRAWARGGGWMPRIETTLTLARSIAPASAAEPGQITFDAAIDRLSARRLLRAQSWAAGWARRDAQGFDHAVRSLVQTAHALARAAAAVPPAERDAHWRQGRELLGIGSGPGAAERLLARVALEWAAAGAPPPTDVLFSLRPAAWIVLQAGGSDAVAHGLMSCADLFTPCLLIDADPPADDPFGAIAAEVDVAVCADFEDEAQRSAAHVLAHLEAGRAPVGLIAQDRLLIRRVRALLSRQQVSLQDETGWKLSTTRAAATVVAMLRAAAHAATTDDWLDWLKSCAPAWPHLEQGDGALQALESKLRRGGWAVPASVDASALPERAGVLWDAAHVIVEALAQPRTRSLPGWLTALQGALQACGAWQAFLADDAGRQVIVALHLDTGAGLPDADAMTLDEFAAWARAALEDASFVPPAPGDAQVVVTPLERAMMRPFASIVMPGADEKRLGAAAPVHPLLGEAAARALGLPDAARRREAETLAFAQLLRLPRVTLLRRRDDGGEPLSPSPLLERLALAAQRAGRALGDAPDPRVSVSIDPQPLTRPQPVAPDLLPQRLSASACEALRVCPYRFFALRMLGLREADELAEDIEKRDYGSWLHEVLYRFHQRRQAPRPTDEEIEALQAIAEEVRREMHLDDPSFLPYAASFARIAPRYLDWLRLRDRQGVQWLDGEREIVVAPPQWGGIEMEGRIDRIDSLPRADAAPATQLIDYKTSSGQRLRQRVAEAQEDTQLAFYAALVAQADAPDAIEATYLSLDDNDSLREVKHRGVQASAVQLVEGMGRELQRLREGAALPALGEGDSCRYCEARGMCQRDHWPAEEPSS
ncbi:PD-(D/E)XK nuclease family protein [Piscinibacter sp. XHJ-5]|uniref:PD-(D/E)XK nuclease family protein n=1 Tax=Piscinibacter sp. XHJ-5 TaxID=3037797 RepID=UPI002452E177|nr:PD-(D/E)XK nuclease family protein [Piscinibacter sp. XHJ-5]